MSSCKTDSKKLTENVPSQAELNATLTPNTTRKPRSGIERLEQQAIVRVGVHFPQNGLENNLFVEVIAESKRLAIDKFSAHRDT